MISLRSPFRDLAARLCLVSIIALGSASTAAAKPTLWLIGDSTVQVGTPGQQGWGTQLPQFFDTSKIDIENRAKGGRSSRTFLTEGLWEDVLKKLKPGDYVMMQFGHNDSGPIGGEFAPGRPARASIKGNDDKSEEVEMPGGKKEVVHSYGWYLRKYATEAKEKGAHPIIISLIPRRGFVDGKARRDGGSYAGWAKDAAEKIDVPFLDLNTLVADKYDELGEEKSTAFFNDNVHTTPAGAEFNARCVAEGVRDLEGSDLKQYLSDKVGATGSEDAGSKANGAGGSDWDKLFKKK